MMRGVIFWVCFVFVVTSVSFDAMPLGTLCYPGPCPHEEGPFVVKYKKDPVHSFTYYEQGGVKHAFFATEDNALEWMNTLPKDKVIGLFKLSEVPLNYVKTGTRKVIKQEPRKVDEDVFEWKNKQN